VPKRKRLSVLSVIVAYSVPSHFRAFVGILSECFFAAYGAKYEVFLMYAALYFAFFSSKSIAQTGSACTRDPFHFSPLCIADISLSQHSQKII
jgi:hypothetical protein